MDFFKLFMQEILFLRLFDTLAYLVLYLVLQALHLEFLLKQHRKRFETLLRFAYRQDFHLFFRFYL